MYYTYIYSSFACFHNTLHYEETWAYFMAIDSREMDFL